MFLQRILIWAVFASIAVAAKILIELLRMIPEHYFIQACGVFMILIGIGTILFMLVKLARGERICVG